MDIQLANEILECLRGERTLYRYAKDQYAVYLLARYAQNYERVSLADIKQSSFGSLLQKPIFRMVLANAGDGNVTADDFSSWWWDEQEAFILTLGRWASPSEYPWAQTSRPGTNLVLQLNLSSHWAREFRALYHQDANTLIDFGHPLSETRNITLAWARLDVDFDQDEVLIEELQSDLVREIECLRKQAQWRLAEGSETFWYCGSELNTRSVIAFSERFRDRFYKSWSEIMLAASLEFIFDELGVGQVYLHEFETGNALKNIEFRKPPRSLYSQLPKRFCFKETERVPKILAEERALKRKLKKLKTRRWFHMAA
jgi:hypothetical protein